MAIDRPRHRLYVSGGDDREYALDLSTGAIAPGWPVTISANVLHEHLRTRSWLAIGLVVCASAGAAGRRRSTVPPDI